MDGKPHHIMSYLCRNGENCKGFTNFYWLPHTEMFWFIQYVSREDYVVLWLA